MTTVEELIEDFADLDEREACELLDELGREIPKIPEAFYADRNLVPGCQSRVWLVNDLTDTTPPTVHIQADSDAFVVRGLIYVVQQMYGGMTPQEVLEVDYADYFDRLGLGRLILPQRKNGLYSMVRKIREFAATAAGVEAETRPAMAVLDDNGDVEPSRSIDGIAAEFPVLIRPLPNGDLPVFLDSGSSAQKPRAVIEKEREVEEEYYANAFRGKYLFGQRVDDEIQASRTNVARFIRAARTDEIIFTSGTTMSINLVARSLGRRLKPGDEIIVTEMEHHANYVPWQVAAQDHGATLKILPITGDGRLDQNAFDELIGERTAIVAVSSMSNVLGTVNPIRELTQRAHEHGALVLVDAAQSVPHEATDVQAWDVDFLSFSGHKLYGPSGIGVLYGKYDLLKDMEPLLYGGHMIERVDRLTSTWAEPPARFEAGTMPIVQIIGLGAAIDFVRTVGFEAIQRHEHELLVAAHRRLEAIPGLVIHGPSVEHKGAIVSFHIDGVSPEDLALRLDDRGVFTRHGHHCAMVLHRRLGVPATTRASFGMYNDTNHVEALANAIEAAIAELR